MSKPLGVFALSFEMRDRELIWSRASLAIRAAISEAFGYSTTRAVVFEDPDGQMIELIQLPSEEEIQHVRALDFPQ